MSSRPGVVFQQSLVRCLENDQFLTAFYERFLGASEEIREKFADTDFAVQHGMLERSLRLSAAAAEGDRAALQEINERAVSHDHEHLDIRPELYDIWLETIVAAAAQYDDLWSAEIEEAWRRILSFVISRMTDRY